MNDPRTLASRLREVCPMCDECSAERRDAADALIRAMRVVEQVPQAHAWHRESANTDVLALCPFALCRAYAAWDEGTLL